MGRADIIELLLNEGADIYAKGGVFGSPLQAAVVCQNMEIALLLFCLGAEVSPRVQLWDDLLERIKKTSSRWYERLEGLQKDSARIIANETRDLHERLQKEWLERPNEDLLVANLQELMKLA
jgi:hypothetical protein